MRVEGIGKLKYRQVWKIGGLKYFYDSIGVLVRVPKDCDASKLDFTLKLYGKGKK